MNQINIQALEPIKLPLVQKLYKKHYPSAKAKKDELIFIGYCHNELCSVVRFRSIDRWRLLTGMMVIPEFRQKGVAHEMMRYCKQKTLSDYDYCFAYSHLAEFYTQHGFSIIPNEKLPNPLQQLFERYSNSGKQLIPMKFDDF